MAENKKKTDMPLFVATAIIVLVNILMIFSGCACLIMGSVTANLYPEKADATVIGYTEAEPYINMETGELQGEGRYSAVLRVEVDGTEYTVNSFNSYKSEPYEIGEQVTLYYDPENMEVNSISGENHFLTAGIVLLAASAAVTAVAAILLIKLFRSAKKG